jgi:hypothetical protein
MAPPLSMVANRCASMRTTHLAPETKKSDMPSTRTVWLTVGSVVVVGASRQWW